MSAPLQLIGRWIAAALAPDRLPVRLLPHERSESEWLSVVEVANVHRLVPAVGAALLLRGESIAVPADLREYFTLIYDQNRQRNEALLDQLSVLIRAFNAQGIDPLLLKGVAELLVPQLPDPGMRLIGDIDLLVAEADLERAVEITLALGYCPRGSEMKIAPGEHHYPALFHPERLAAVEIHRTLGRKEWFDRFDSKELLTRARKVERSGLRFSVLAPTDAAIYLPYHTQLHHLTLDSEIRGARHLDFFALLLLSRELVDVSTVERWFIQHDALNALQVELALIEEIFGFVPNGFQPLTLSAKRRARRLLWRAQVKVVRRVWRTFYLISRGLSRARFESETEGGGGGKLFVWRLRRVRSLMRKYANPLRILQLSRWIDSSTLVNTRTKPDKKG